MKEGFLGSMQSDFQECERTTCKHNQDPITIETTIGEIDRRDDYSDFGSTEEYLHFENQKTEQTAKDCNVVT